MNIARHKSQAMKIPKRVWLTGTAAAEFKKGTGVCYNRDYGTDTEREGERDSRVEVPTTSNNLNFAGVLDHNVTIPSTGEILVTINEPGSVCDIAVGSDTVVDTTHLWCLAASGSPGRFRADTGTHLGRGAAKALQTNASGITGQSIDGTAVVSTATVTKTALFADATAGDFLVILAGCTAAGAAGSAPAIYTISSVTSDDEAVLTASPGDGDIACYVMPAANATVMAYLFDGEESGLIEWVDMLNNTAIGATAMVAGCTHIMGGVTLAGGVCTDTVADGTFPGEKKGFVLHGALTSNAFDITVTSGLQHNGTTALAGIEMDADGDYAFMTWRVDEWMLDQQGGVTLVNS